MGVDKVKGGQQLEQILDGSNPIHEPVQSTQFSPPPCLLNRAKDKQAILLTLVKSGTDMFPLKGKVVMGCVCGQEGKNHNTMHLRDRLRYSLNEDPLNGVDPRRIPGG